MSQLARAVDLVAFAVSLGSVVWFFFVQTPVLLARLGRDRFVPLQLALAPPLFRTTLALSLLGALAAFGASHTHLALGLAGAAVVVSLLLVVVVVPRAVRAGGASLKESLAPDAQVSVGRFTADGGGEATKLWHRVLGLLAVALVALSGAHLVVSTQPAEHGPGHDHEAAAPTSPAAHTRWKANAETVAGVRELQALVKAARQGERGTLEVGSELRMAFNGIFERCTMTGAAHEALHGFLLPTGELLGALDQATDQPSAAAVLARLDAHLATFDRDFE